MRINLDVRRIQLRGSERVVFDVTDTDSARTVHLPPQPVDLAFDSLQATIMDMIATNRDSGMTPAVKPDSDAITALIPKPKP